MRTDSGIDPLKTRMHAVHTSWILGSEFMLIGVRHLFLRRMQHFWKKT